MTFYLVLLTLPLPLFISNKDRCKLSVKQPKSDLYYGLDPAPCIYSCYSVFFNLREKLLPWGKKKIYCS